MRKLLVAAAGVAALVAAAPASAQAPFSGQLSYGGRDDPSWYGSYGYGPRSRYGYIPPSSYNSPPLRSYGYSYGPSFGSGYAAPFGSYGYSYSNTPFGAGGANGAAAWWSYRPPSGSFGGPYGYDSAYGGSGAYAYGADCPLVRQRIVTSSGRVIYRTRDAC